MTTLTYLNNSLTELLANKYENEIGLKNAWNFVRNSVWGTAIQEYTAKIQKKYKIETDTTDAISDKELQKYIDTFMYENKLRLKLIQPPENMK